MDDDLGVAATGAVEHVNMDPLARQQRAKAIFLDALEVPQEGRVAFVESRALGDPDLANEVLSLLGHHRQDPLLARDRAPQTGRDPLGVEGATLDGRYRVQQFVDEGGFSYVYRGEHLLWKRPVALKFHRDLLAEQQTHFTSQQVLARNPCFIGRRPQRENRRTTHRRRGKTCDPYAR